MKEVTFIASEAEEGGYYARAVGASFFKQAETLDELRLMIKDAIECYFSELQMFKLIMSNEPFTLHR